MLNFFNIIFNTSFNLGGEPLVETLKDAFRTLAVGLDDLNSSGMTEIEARDLEDKYKFRY